MRASSGGDVEVLRPDAGQRGQRAAEHVVQAAMHRRALQRPEVADALDDADQRAVALRVGADRARIAAVEVAAQAAGLHRARGLGQRGGERQHARLRLLQHLQRGPAGAARAHAGQLRQQADQVLDFGAAHRAASSRSPAHRRNGERAKGNAMH